MTQHIPLNAKDSETVHADTWVGEQHTHTVFVRDYETQAAIGVYESEQGRQQSIRLNLDLTVKNPSNPVADDYSDVVCYDTLIQKIETLLATGHVGLVETLAEKVAALALEEFRVLAVRVRIEKLEAIQSAASVGVEIQRVRART